MHLKRGYFSKSYPLASGLLLEEIDIYYNGVGWICQVIQWNILGCLVEGAIRSIFLSQYRQDVVDFLPRDSVTKIELERGCLR